MSSITNIWKRFISFITFINLPIKKKFFLFGLGTFFWFALVGIVAVSVLTFIHYRYSQISHTTIPYIQAIQVVKPKLDTISQLSTWASQNKENREYISQVSEELREIQNAITLEAVSIKNTNEESNFFEMLTYTLSKDDPKGAQTIQALLTKIKHIEGILTKEEKIVWSDFQQEIKETKNIIEAFSERTNSQLNDYTQQMQQTIKYSINSIAFIILIAITLLFFFTRWLTDAFSKPIESMIQQIHSIGTGEVDLSKKLKIKSEDEIGALSMEFNKLVDTVYGVTVFKKVIEEDTSLEIVYSRLAEVFEKEAKIEEFRIFDVNTAKKEMYITHPPLGNEENMFCHGEILHDCTLCRAQKTGHSISSLEYQGICRQFLQESGKEHICIPLIVAGQTGAIVQFLFDKKESDANIDTINEKIFKAESYIKNSLSVIETKQLMQTLRESSLIDGLTGLYNRRFLQDHSQQIISGVLRRKKQISLLMCDMDYFKQVNDEHGHDAGDSLLKETSLILRNSVRESDVVIRFGGEEFLILLIDTEPDYGIEVAEKIRKKVEATKFNIGAAGVIKKTISMGICEFPKDTEGFWQAIKYADVALYKAKNSGRNRCVKFTPDLWEKSDF